MRTVNDVIANTPSPSICRLAAPPYRYRPLNRDGDHDRPRVGMAVKSMKDHTTDEGWQIFQGLESAGYDLAGHDLFIDSTDTGSILRIADPAVVVVQDKREWEGLTAGGISGFNHRETFSNIEALRYADDVFKVTVLKDAQHNPDYHRNSAQEMGCHAWIHYYHPRIVAHLAPYVRPQHLIRTWHSIDKALVPPFDQYERNGALLSGAVSGAYPLRRRLFDADGSLPDVSVLKHPGYHRSGCATPAFLQELPRYKVAICTSSIYGYALRKIIEATACGCMVITDLPKDEQLPEIDGNLFRVDPSVSLDYLTSLLHQLYAVYRPETQLHYAQAAMRFYDYRTVGLRLAADIETARSSYADDVCW